MDRKTHVIKGVPGNHCICDQALRVLPNGQWAIIYMTGGDHEPRRENYIAMVRSDDRGATWSSPETVLRYEDRACLLTEVVVHKSRVIIFAQEHGGSLENWRVFQLISDDSGATWGRPIPFTPLPQRAFIRNLYVASWGEWLLPFQVYDTEPFTPQATMQQGSWVRQAHNGVLISADEGAGWTRSASCGPVAGWPENNVVELADETLAMLIRTTEGHLKRSDSHDRGRTWSPPAATDIPNPGTKFRLFKLSDGRIALIHNPNPRPSWHTRNPLALWISSDDMRSWAYRRVLTDFPGQLQYPDGFLDEEEGYIHFAFDYNRHDLIYWGAKLPG